MAIAAKNGTMKISTAVADAAARSAHPPPPPPRARAHGPAIAPPRVFLEP